MFFNTVFNPFLLVKNHNLNKWPLFIHTKKILMIGPTYWTTFFYIWQTGKSFKVLAVQNNNSILLKTKLFL